MKFFFPCLLHWLFNLKRHFWSHFSSAADSGNLGSHFLDQSRVSFRKVLEASGVSRWLGCSVFDAPLQWGWTSIPNRIWSTFSHCAFVWGVLRCGGVRWYLSYFQLLWDDHEIVKQCWISERSHKKQNVGVLDCTCSIHRSTLCNPRVTSLSIVVEHFRRNRRWKPAGSLVPCGRVHFHTNFHSLLEFPTVHTLRGPHQISLSIVRSDI